MGQKIRKKYKCHALTNLGWIDPQAAPHLLPLDKLPFNLFICFPFPFFFFKNHFHQSDNFITYYFCSFIISLLLFGLSFFNILLINIFLFVISLLLTWLLIHFLIFIAYLFHLLVLICSFDLCCLSFVFFFFLIIN